TQVLAAFLGLDDLEELARRQNPKFKVYLAQKLWALHRQTRGGILADGYTGPTDERLVEFAKEHWMRRNYGGKAGQTILDLARERTTYGPGWKCNPFETGGVKEATAFVDLFLDSLPTWAKTVKMFLEACEYLGQHADQYRGVVFIDPHDGAEVRWNPA